MNYNFNGKTIKINDEWIEKTMKSLEMTKDEVIEMYLEDEGYLDNEEQNELDNLAKKVKIDHGARDTSKKKQSKPKTVKVSDEKKALFTMIFNLLGTEFGENAEILKENKLISVKIGEKTFKIDLIEQRMPKK